MELNFTYLFITLIFSLLPDIDKFNTKISKKTRPLSLIFNIARHRTIFHSLITVSAACLILWYSFGLNWAVFAFTGLASHLILDAMTPGGIMLFYPLSRKKTGLAIGRILPEMIVLWLSLFLDITLLFFLI